MTAIFRTSMMVMASVLLLALSASAALAAPGNGYIQDQMLQMDPDTVAHMQSMIQSGQLQLDGIVPADDDDEYVVPPEDPGDEGQIPPDEGEEVIQCEDENGAPIPCEPEPLCPGEPGDEFVPGGDPGEPEELVNPGTPETETPPATVPPAETPRTPSSKLPNTGTHLVIIAGMGLALAAAAFAARRLIRR